VNDLGSRYVLEEAGPPEHQRMEIDMRNRWWAAPGAAAAVALIAACGSSGTSGTASGGSSPATSGSSAGATGGTVSVYAAGLKTASEDGGTVLTTAQGFTLYWFAKDTPTMSNCTGSCATFWPPLVGKPTMGSGASLAGHLGTIKRAGGQVQATYDGHPLYLYKGDTAAGQVHGNDLTASGGLWWAMTSSGAKLAAAAKPSASASKSGGSGGYGY
jgi:predicted lipoprotein with Yx(FWY)xxD motif